MRLFNRNKKLSDVMAEAVAEIKETFKEMEYPFERD
jgi:hypothetical protein